MSNPQRTESLADGYVKWLRDQVGSQLIYLVYASGVIFDAQGRILVQTRYDFDWLSVPGGAMELREALAETARREVLEETGIEADINGFAGVLTHPQYNLQYPNGDQVQQWTAIFWGEVAGGELRPDGGETLSARFMPPEEFLTSNIHPSHAAMVRAALRARAGQPPELEAVETVPPIRPYYPILRARIPSEQAIILPGAMAIIEDEQGRILMTHRSDFNYWELPAGLADLGETSTANIIREVREETGLEVEPYALVGLYSDPRWHYFTYPSGDVTHGIAVVFACRVTGGTLVAEGADNENDAIRFMSIEERMAEAFPFEATYQTLLDYQDRAGWPHMR
jgi:8-oxo-dGTP pyrophosphatase MutT (NUDIX family)